MGHQAKPSPVTRHPVGPMTQRLSFDSEGTLKRDYYIIIELFDGTQHTLLVKRLQKEVELGGSSAQPSFFGHFSALKLKLEIFCWEQV
ncbi:hypothetical protein ACLOJK_012678 [Asimina triloba]